MTTEKRLRSLEARHARERADQRLKVLEAGRIDGPSETGDDTEIIQAALDAGHQIVLLGPGTYRADGLVVPTNVTLGGTNTQCGFAFSYSVLS